MNRRTAVVAVLALLAVALAAPGQGCPTAAGSSAVVNASYRGLDADGNLGVALDVISERVVALDLTIPSQPRELGSSAAIAGVLDVALSGDTAYAVNGTSSIFIIDLSIPSTPRLVNTISGGRNLDRISVDGPFAIVREGRFGVVHLVDVANPQAARFRTNFSPSLAATDLAISGIHAYVVADDGTIQVWSLADPDRAVSLGISRFSSSFVRGSIDKNLLVTFDGSANGVTVFDISRVLPERIGSLETPGIFDVAISGCFAYAVSSNWRALSLSGCAAGLCETADRNLRLLGGRFNVGIEWADDRGNRGIGRAVRLTDNSGYFWFFDRSNAEVQVKMLNACVPPFNRYWFFAAGLTDVEVTVTVSDTVSGRVERYVNPQKTPFAPVQDTSRWNVCP